MRRRAEPIWELVEQNLHEAAILFGLWQRACVSPRYTLAEVVAGPEERLAAHLDGVVVGGPPAVDRVLGPALEGEEPKLAAAAVLALAQLPGAPLERALDAIAQGPPPKRIAAARALSLSRHPRAARLLDEALGAGEPATEAAALEGLALAGVAVPRALAFLSSPDASVQAAAIRAARRSSAAIEPLESLLGSAAPAVRDAAMAGALALGRRSALRAAERAVDEGTAPLELPLLVLGMSGEADALDRLEGALASAKHRRAALRGLGLSGQVRAAELCLEYMVNPELAQVAGEAFASITGLRLEGELLADAPAGPDEPIPLADEDLEADLVEGPEAELPYPDADAVAGWWKRHRKALDPRARWIDGQAFSADGVRQLFVAGSMRRRVVLAMELCIRTAGRYDVDPGTWAREQLEAQRLPPPPSGAAFARPFSQLLAG